MKSLFILVFMMSTLSFAQNYNQVMPSPTDKPPGETDIQGTIAEPTPEQKAAVKPPKAAKKAKKKKKSRKAAK